MTNTVIRKNKFQFRLIHLEILLLAALGAMLIAWALIGGGEAVGPDEPMRYVVARYFYNNPGSLPNGGAEDLRDPQWGFSYALYPYLSYMVSAVYMKIASIFSTDDQILLYAARMANVTFIMIASVLIYIVGRRLFGGIKGFFFASLVVFMPGFHFMGTYVNCDALALLSAAIILYGWVCVLQDGCTWRNCLVTAIGLGVCLLSYYNAYGWVLCSFIFFCYIVLLCRPTSMKERLSFFITRALFVIAVTLGISGWFFVHNYIIYDGDFLGLNTSTWLGETYAENWLKPSQHVTPQKMHWSIIELITYQCPGWPHNWLLLSLLSYFGTFGTFDVWMNDNVSKLYFLFTAVGLVGMCMFFYRFSLRNRTVIVNKTKEGTAKVKTTVIRTERTFSAQNGFDLTMLFAMLIPVAIYVRYVYLDDIQAQGRYMIMSVYAVMYFVTVGFQKIFRTYPKIAKWENLFYKAASAVWILGAFFNFFTVIVPRYR